MDAVSTRNLTKTYQGKQKVHALKGVSISIAKGQLFTLLGKNGAGKTTFLRIISTQLLPTEGEATVLGYDALTEEEKIREHIAIVPQDVASYGSYTPWDYCYYFSLLRGVTKQAAKDASEKALRSLKLWDLKDRACATLSGGEKKRAIISIALSSEADLLMLDEPTSGLDAVTRRDVWIQLRKLVEQGKTVLLTTHIMEEAEMLSDRLAIMHKGEIVAEGTPDEIRSFSEDRFRITAHGDLGNLDLSSEPNRILKLGNKSLVYYRSEKDALSFLSRALRSGVRAEIAPITLEDAFVKMVGEEI